MMTYWIIKGQMPQIDPENVKPLIFFRLTKIISKGTSLKYFIVFIDRSRHFSTWTVDFEIDKDLYHPIDISIAKNEKVNDS